MFFFEKKNQKTFIRFGWHPCPPVEQVAGRICKSFLLLFFKKEVLPFFLSLHPAIAQVRSVDLHPPTRDFGYFLGDTMTLEAVIILAPGTRIDTNSLPTPGQIGPGLDIKHVETSQAGNVLRVRVEYQDFVAPEEAMQSRTPAYNLAFHNGAARYTARVPFWSFYTSPFRHEREQTVDPAALRPDRAVSPLPLQVPRNGFFASLCIALVSAGALASGQGWLPRFGPRRKPFAEAAHRIGRLVRQRSGAPSDAIRALHRAFDATAGRRVFAEDMPELLVQRPELACLRTEIEQFFGLSRAHFFAPGNAIAAADISMQQVRDLAAKLRRAERAA